MSVKLAQNGTVLLTGDCQAEDADLLLQHLLKQPDVPVDWAECTSAHSAVIQVLLCAARVPDGEAKLTFLNVFIGPALDRAGNK